MTVRAAWIYAVVLFAAVFAVRNWVWPDLPSVLALSGIVAVVYAYKSQASTRSVNTPPK